MARVTGKKPNWARRTAVDNITDQFGLTAAAGAALVFPELISCKDSSDNPIKKVEADFLGTTIDLSLYINLPKGSKISALALTTDPGVYIKTAVAGTAGWTKQQEVKNTILTPSVTAGSTGATVTEFIFVAPKDCTITKANAIVDIPQVGTGNTPTVGIYNGSTAVGISAAIALSGSAGDVEPIVLDVAEVALSAGDVLSVKVINPAGTITTALKAKVQLEWKSTY